VYFKEQRYEKTKTQTLNSSYTRQLPDTGILSQIDIRFYVTNASSVINGAPMNIHHHITKIEVIGNNDKTLISMTGEEALAKAYRKLGRLPHSSRTEIGNAAQRQSIPILFGRKLWDKDYALDLSQWDKVELIITNDMSSTYWSGLTADIQLMMIEEIGAAPPRFLKQWEYDKTKPAYDTDYLRVKLPTSGLLRSLMIQLDPDLTASTAAPVNSPDSDSYNWKLYFKDRALAVIDARPKDLYFRDYERFGLGRDVVKPYSSTTQYTDYIWAYVIGRAIAPIENSTLVVPNSLESSNNRYHVFKAVGSDIQDDVITVGCAPFHTFEIPFYVPEDVEANYLDLAAYQPIEIEWYGYKDDNTHRMVLEKPIGQGEAGFA